MVAIWARFVADESGGPAIEYGLVAGLVSIGIIAGSTDIAVALSGMISAVSGLLSSIIVA